MEWADLSFEVVADRFLGREHELHLGGVVLAEDGLADHIVLSEALLHFQKAGTREVAQYNVGVDEADHPDSVLQ